MPTFIVPGDNDRDDSGILRYVVVKHTGATVGNGDELNGISFGGVGNATVVDNLQVYSTYDDGVEMFGGSVNINNLVAVYVRDDSIDIDEGYNGTITNALVVQQENDGDHCIEADGLGSYSGLDQATKDDFIARGLNSAPTISNLTCIVSANEAGTHSDGSGWRLREGIHPTISNALVISSFGANDVSSSDDNYCLRIDSDETIAAAVAGDLSLNSVIFSCQEPSRGTPIGAFADEQLWAESNGNQFAADAVAASGAALNPTAAADTSLQLLEGPQSVYSISWATSFVDGAAPIATTQPTAGDLLGAVSAADDWTRPWAYGIDPDNRGQALWFE